MTGCRHDAKNTLVKNYLYLAEAGRRGGAPAHHRHRGAPARPAAATHVDDRAHRAADARPPRTFTADQVVFAAGTLGTQRLLHRMRDTGVLPRLSARLGELTRTNSEAILGAVHAAARGDADFTRGVAITPRSTRTTTPTSSRSGTARARNLMGLLQTVHDRRRRRRAALAELGQALAAPPDGGRRGPVDVRQLVASGP